MSPHHDEPEYSNGGAVGTPSENGVISARALIPGVYVPTVVFFDAQGEEEVDVETVAEHAVRLADGGVAGLVVQGSNGEAVHLTSAERDLLTLTTRRALDTSGHSHLPLIAGCGAQSTKETIQLCRSARRAGADYVLVLPPAYYKGLLTPDSLVGYFRDVADASPCPVLIYNFPAATAGTDLDSDAIISLARHPNIAGCKLTCGNTGKLNRIVAGTTDCGGFLCFGGSADFTTQAVVGGGAGVIAGLANIAPKSCVTLMQKALKSPQDTQSLQAIVARADWAAIKAGVPGTKAALQTYVGYGGYARRPLPRPTKEDVAKYAVEFREIMALEKSL